QVDRLSARLEERHDAVRTALPGTIQHWNLNLNPPHTRNSGYLLESGFVSVLLEDVTDHSFFFTGWASTTSGFRRGTTLQIVVLDTL
ncbi:hypothetical protein, partial [Burkholderia multivorans]|uniref:hypothetical protein n=1 Tax=Burkholderia multivorans TaxID=87883 RepID=UPI0031010778